MPSQRSFIKDHKQRGEWAELRFMARAAEHGLSVSKPWGDSQRYDVTVEHNGRFLRVQVKSTVAKFCDGYVCSIRSSRGQHYTRREVDFFAIYVVLEDAWYIMPAAVVVPLKGHFMLAPRRKGQKYERYLEAWDLLRGKDRDKEKDKYKDTTIPQPTSAAVEHPQTEPSNLFNSERGSQSPSTLHGNRLFPTPFQKLKNCTVRPRRVLFWDRYSGRPSPTISNPSNHRQLDSYGTSA